MRPGAGRTGRAIAALALVVLAACNNERSASDSAAAGTRAADRENRRAIPMPQAPPGLALQTAGSVRAYVDASFEVYWPSGCGRLIVREPERLEEGEMREYSYACDRDGKEGRGCSVYVIRNGRDEQGNPPTPKTVVDAVELRLESYQVRVERQRPLQAPGIEGVEVHAYEPDGPGEVWIRGLLTGANIYILSAWSLDGHLFDDAEMGDFFASFRVIPGGE